MRGPAVALFQARPPGRRLRVTALPSCMELSETQNRQNLAIHGIWMYGMLFMYVDDVDVAEVNQQLKAFSL